MLSHHLSQPLDACLQLLEARLRRRLEIGLRRRLECGLLGLLECVLLGRGLSRWLECGLGWWLECCVIMRRPANHWGEYRLWQRTVHSIQLRRLPLDLFLRCNVAVDRLLVGNMCPDRRLDLRRGRLDLRRGQLDLRRQAHVLGPLRIRLVLCVASRPRSLHRRTHQHRTSRRSKHSIASNARLFVAT